MRINFQAFYQDITHAQSFRALSPIHAADLDSAIAQVPAHLNRIGKPDAIYILTVRAPYCTSRPLDYAIYNSYTRERTPFTPPTLEEENARVPGV